MKKYNLITLEDMKKITTRNILFFLITFMILLLFGVISFILAENYKFENLIYKICVVVTSFVLMFISLLSLFWGCKLYKEYKKGKSKHIVSLEFNEDGIYAIYPNGERIKYEYSLFKDVAIKIYSPRGVKWYHSLYDFLEHFPLLFDYILDNRYITVMFFKKIGEKIKRYALWWGFDINLGAINGKTALEKMLKDWRESYEEYLRKVGRCREYKHQYEEIKRKRVIRKGRVTNMARIHFYALIIIVILSVIMFIYLSMIPYLTTPPSSPEYDEIQAFLIVDASLTTILIIIGIIKLPILWKKDRKH